MVQKYTKHGHVFLKKNFFFILFSIIFGVSFKCIFLNESDKIPIQISLKFVPRSPIDNKPALVQGMAWRQTGDNPLPEPMMTQFVKHIVPLGGDEFKKCHLNPHYKPKTVWWLPQVYNGAAYTNKTVSSSWIRVQSQKTGLILGLRPANERRRYKVTSFLIGWAQT